MENIVIERYTDPQVMVDDLIADGVPAEAEDLIAALLDDELNEMVMHAIEIVRAKY